MEKDRRDMIQTTVEDDGIGFDTSIIDGFPWGSRGFGLFSIRERMNYLGGYLEILSKPGFGARVSMVVPPLKIEGDREK